MADWGLGQIGTRLALSFVAVALMAEAAFVSVSVVTERSDVASLASAQRSETTGAVISALDNAYRASDGWTGADLQPAVALVDVSGGGLALDSPEGAALLRSGRTALLGNDQGVLVRRSLSTDRQVIGTLRLAFPAGGLSPAEQRLRSALWHAVGLSAAIATAVALAVALFAARGLVRPIRRLSAAAQALGSGVSGARTGEPRGPGELGELARAFDSMAASLERHEQLRNALVADVAHELRTPVAVLQAETEALLDGMSAFTPESVVSLHDESLRLGRMVEDLQTLASADAAGLRLERSWVDLATVAAQSAGSLESRFSSSGVRLERGPFPAPVWADPARIRQVLTNLLMNAAKFTPSGGTVTLFVDTCRHGARLEVTDTGPGIQPEELDQVFERFFRGSAGRKAGGSGIGLAVVKDLVEAHGGQVRVESPPLGGARFIVLLPSSTGARKH